MLTGAKIVYKGFSSFMVAADTSTIAMEESIAKIIEDGKHFNAVNPISSLEFFKNAKEYKGLKRPLTVFSFMDEESCDKFIEEYNIKSLLKNQLDWEQEKMHMEDQVQSDMDANEIASFEEIATGKKSSNITIGALYGIDKEDPWDTRTEKEKAEDLMNNSGMLSKLVGDGIFTDEAIAPSFEQNIEAQKLPNIDPDNIPEFIMEQFKSQNLSEEDIKEAIKEMNINIDKQNALIDEGVTDPEERIKRIVEQNPGENGFGNLFINKDSIGSDNKSSKKEVSSGKTEKSGPSILDKMKDSGFSSDDVKDILKPSTLEGKKITDFGAYVFENTSMDEYDLNDAISGMKDNGAMKIDTDIDSLPVNIGKDSDITYPDNTDTFILKAVRASEFDEVFIVKIPDIGTGEITGTSNFKVYSIVNDAFVFIPNRLGEHAMVVFDNGSPIIYKIEM